MESAAKRITRSALGTLTSRLLAKATVVAPVRTQGGEADYDVITSAQDVYWDYSTSLAPLKRFLLPQIEPLFSFTDAQGRVTLQPATDAAFRVFLGVRSCDVSGVRFLDFAYSRDYEDPSYTARRRNSMIISLACIATGPNCFCVCGDGGPFLKEGYDLQLVPLGDEYRVEVGSERGQALVDENADLFSPAREGDVEERARLLKQMETSFGEPKSYVAAAMRKISTGTSSTESWQYMGDLCLGCGGCAFLCPTCSCFTTFDHVTGDGRGVRERHWDSCQFECYSREASGHNPRKEQHQRLKSRFVHKISYQFVLRNGRHACVGCGRCVSACFGESSMADVTATIRRGACR